MLQVSATSQLGLAGGGQKPPALHRPYKCPDGEERTHQRCRPDDPPEELDDHADHQQRHEYHCKTRVRTRATPRRHEPTIGRPTDIKVACWAYRAAGPAHSVAW